MVESLDLTLARQTFLDAMPDATVYIERCNVIGPSDGGATDCGLPDIVQLQRFVGGASATIGNVSGS